MKKESKGIINYATTLEWKEIPKTPYSAFKRVVKFKSPYKLPSIKYEGIAKTQFLKKADLDKYDVEANNVRFYISED